MSSKHKPGCGCEEYNLLTRRNFLGLSGGALAAAAIPAWLPRVLLAESFDSSRDVLVSIFLRGGADALTICPPWREDAYYRLRPTLAVPRPDSGSPHAAIDLDGFFGFAPAMRPLMEAWQDKSLLVVHGCGLPDPTRSHFSAMHFLEVGQPGGLSLFQGWIARHLLTSTPLRGDAPLRGLALGYGLPRSLVGAPQTVPVRDLSEAGLAGDPATAAERRRALQRMHTAAIDPMRLAAETTFRTMGLLERIDFSSYVPAGGAAYPEDELGRALKSTAALIKAAVGVEAVAIDLGGWDTHEHQQPFDGAMFFLMRTLAEGLAAFHKDLFTDNHRNVVVVVQSEFGRNAYENGSFGCDHGHGSLMLLLGGHVNGGQVKSDWKGLEPEHLWEGQDLQSSIDNRDALTEILVKRLGCKDWRQVFPDSTYTYKERGVAA